MATDAPTAASLHDLALEAERNLEQLATGLASAGAEDNVVNAVSQMADATRKIASALGKGQEQTADSEPPAPEQQAQPSPNGFENATQQHMAEQRANQ